GCFDVFEIDTAKSWLERFYRLNEVVRVRTIQLDVEYIDIGELLEQHGFALHHRLGGMRPYVAKTENGSAIRYDTHQVAAARVFERVILVFGDFKTGGRHSGRVGDRKILLRRNRFPKSCEN